MYILVMKSRRLWCLPKLCNLICWDAFCLKHLNNIHLLVSLLECRMWGILNCSFQCHSAYRQSTWKVIQMISSIFTWVYCTLSLLPVIPVCLLYTVLMLPKYFCLLSEFLLGPFFFFLREDMWTEQDQLTIRVSGKLEEILAAYVCCPLSTVPGWYEWINDGYCYFCHNYNGPKW